MDDEGGHGVMIEVKLSINQAMDQKSTKCEICGKVFRTMKALYGHMRSHPERTWRGMHPSSASSSATAAAARSSSSSSAASAGSSTSLPTWSVTGRRGRKRTDSASISASTSAASASNKERRMDELCWPSKKKMHLYQCNVCGKGFWSPQALGGHKSSHYKGTTQQPSSEFDSPMIDGGGSAGTTSVKRDETTPSNQSGRRMVDFDLNELPPMDDGGDY